MAVYTDVGGEELAEFLRAYEIGRPLSVKGIAEGVENSNFFLHTEGGSYILTLYEKRVRLDDLPYFLGLMEHLAAAGLRCPQPVRRRDGEALGRLAGRPAAIVTFLDGLSVARPVAAHCAAVGAALAELHRAGDGFAFERRNALSIDGWRPLYAHAGRAGAETVMPGLSACLERELGWAR